jgi:putative selenate reductase
MSQLTGVSLEAHLDSIFSEYKYNKTIYGYPDRKMYKGFPGFDFSVELYGKKAATPLGPAAGPHTQLAQNIILSFLGGSRIIELKTIQILDQLQIPRPCIDIRNIGYNVEWSQELNLTESYRQYVTAWILLKIIQEDELLGVPKNNPFYNTIFDISVGYNLKGISSPKVKNWIDDMLNAEDTIKKLLNSLPAKYNQYKKLVVSPQLSDSVTLSTFHGCPAHEIEEIVKHLIALHNVNVIVKMNPTLLGYEFVSDLLRRQLGYKNIELDKAAFRNDLTFNQAISMMRRLKEFAEQKNKILGAKFTNTLVVKNNENIFKEQQRYLSGAPLYVIAMQTMHAFRQAMGDDFPVSFSGGIDKNNFSDAVLCNMTPVTTCTDLLKKGGYTRLFDYLKNLKKTMEKTNARTIDQFIINNADKEHRSNRLMAGAYNTSKIVPTLNDNPEYHYIYNTGLPRRTDSRLTFFDCLSCNICLPVCPNAALFSIKTGIIRLSVTNYRFTNGNFEPAAGQDFILNKENQIANIAEFCNECGNCDTYCPEHGAPCVIKPRFFIKKLTLKKFDWLDGFCFAKPNHLLGRINKHEYQLIYNPTNNEYSWISSLVEFKIDNNCKLLAGKVLKELKPDQEIRMDAFYIMKVLFDALLKTPDIYPVNLLRHPNKNIALQIN